MVPLELVTNIVLIIVGAAVLVAVFGYARAPKNLSSETLTRLEQEKNALAIEKRTLLREREDAIEKALVKSALVAHISHELRTPLSGVIGMLELLQHTSLTIEQRKLVDACNMSAQSLLNVTNHIIDFTRLESKTMEIELSSFDTTELVQDACAAVAERARLKKLFFSTDIDSTIPPLVIGDEKRIRQVIVNLIDNAIKYTHQGGVIISVTLEEEGPAEVVLRFAVKDTGIGLSEEERNGLFNRIPDLDQISRQQGGPALGLFISRRLVELMHGTIGAESNPGEGSTFWFKLTLSTPKRRVEDKAEKTRQTVPAIRPGICVLIVEDNTTLQGLAAKQLLVLGVKSKCVADGQQAIEVTANEQFDLILMDCHLPGVDGFDATRTIRSLEEPGRRRVPIIAMTAAAMQEDREKCLQSGMDDYLCKPVSIEQLREKLHRWLPNDEN